MNTSTSQNKGIRTRIILVLISCLFLGACGSGGGNSASNNASWNTSNWDEANWQ